MPSCYLFDSSCKLFPPPLKSFFAGCSSTRFPFSNLHPSWGNPLRGFGLRPFFANPLLALICPYCTDYGSGLNRVHRLLPIFEPFLGFRAFSLGFPLTRSLDHPLTCRPSYAPQEIFFLERVRFRFPPLTDQALPPAIKLSGQGFFHRVLNWKPKLSSVPRFPVVFSDFPLSGLISSPKLPTPSIGGDQHGATTHGQYTTFLPFCTFSLACFINLTCLVPAAMSPCISSLSGPRFVTLILLLVQL